MTASALECPTCGGPAAQQPVDPSAPLLCPWCGTSYERLGAEEALKALHAEIDQWLQQTTGATASDAGATSIDSATRSFLFNDRILPEARRDVRRAIDEEIGDVLGSPILVPPMLARLPGFTGDDAVLLSARDRILALRGLRARLEAEDVAAFAASAADRLALHKVLAEIDRTMLASHAASALASSGITASRELVRNNLERLQQGARQSVAEAVTDPGGAAVSRAFELRCECILGAVDALRAKPPQLDKLEASASRLEEAAQWLLTTESRDLRGALASTGVHRDATALRILAAVANEAARLALPALELIESMQALAPCFERAASPDDAIAVATACALGVAAMTRGAAIPAVTDTSWGRVAVEAARQGDERAGQIDVVLAPFWFMSARHAKAEGFLFVSGKQVEGFALVAASSASDAALLLGPQEPVTLHIQQALAAPCRAPWQVDLPLTGPSAARQAARTVMRSHELKNVALSEAALVYLPVGVVQLEGSRGRRTAVVGPKGPLPIDAQALSARLAAAQAATAKIGSMMG